MISLTIHRPGTYAGLTTMLLSHSQVRMHLCHPILLSPDLGAGDWPIQRIVMRFIWVSAAKRGGFHGRRGKGRAQRAAELVSTLESSSSGDYRWLSFR